MRGELQCYILDIYMVLIDQFRSIKIKVNARDHNPPHCHVEGNGGKARFNLITMEFMESEGFTKKDLMEITQVIARRYEEILEIWSELHNEE